MASALNNVPLTRMGKKDEVKMAEKKMTQVQALEIAVGALEGMPLEEDAMAREIILGMIEKRKNVTRKPRVNKEAEAFRAELVSFLETAEGPLTNAEMAGHFGVKPQKVANNIRPLEKAGIVRRIRGEKASDKDTFMVA